MKFVLVALAALLTAALPTQAIPQELQPRWSDAIPPARFQGTGLVPVLFVPPALIKPFCSSGDEPPDKVVIACTREVKVAGKMMRIVIMPDPCVNAELEYFAHIQCHENAHYLKNWKHEL